jgi:hypothetical protein
VSNQLEGDTGIAREQCRIDCGVDIIIPSVVSYLIINAEGASVVMKKMNEVCSGDSNSL